MTRGRHSLAPQSSRHRLAYVAVPLVTSAVVGAGVLLSGGAAPDRIDTTRDAASLGGAARLGLGAATPDLGASAPTERAIAASRDRDRLAVTRLINPTVTDRLWATEDLNLRATPTDSAAVAGVVKALTRLGVTGRRENGYAQVVVPVDGVPTLAWVTAQYLATTKPQPAPSTLGLSDAPCPDGSVEHGLTAGAVRVYRAVCHAFPQITSYGGWANRGEHASGKALDIMNSDVALGNQIAEFLQAHAAELNLYDVIWRQHIWTPQRAGEGWRAMPDRGSPTANHMNHVHVSVN